jgi:hypothetical protein
MERAGRIVHICFTGCGLYVGQDRAASHVVMSALK